MVDRIGSKLVTRPLFFDALSGEFVPQSDPDRRYHTLGRLAFAAYEKGTDVTAELDDHGFMLIDYRPSWAPLVGVKVACDLRFDRPTLDSITLTDANNRTLHIADGTPAHPLHVADTRQTVLINSDTSDITIPVPLGEAATARGIITASAQHFFDRAIGSAAGY